MKFFRFDIGGRASKTSRFIGGVRSELLKALTEVKQMGVTQQALAEKLQIPRTQLNDQLVGQSSLTLRAIADLAWALDREITFELRPRVDKRGQNNIAQTSPQTSTISSSTAKVVGAATSSSTLPSLAQTRIVARGTAK